MRNLAQTKRELGYDFTISSLCACLHVKIVDVEIQKCLLECRPVRIRECERPLTISEEFAVPQMILSVVWIVEFGGDE